MILALALLAAAATDAPRVKPDSSITPIASTPLADLPGKVLSSSKVSYPPGGKDPSHIHPNATFVYVLQGSVRSAADDGPVITYKQGDTFYLPAGHTHRVSENASATEPAALLAVQVADQKK